MDQHVKAKLQSHGASQHQIDQLDALPAAVKKAVNWQALLALAAKIASGQPVTLAEVIAVFGPVPTPPNPAPAAP